MLKKLTAICIFRAEDTGDIKAVLQAAPDDERDCAFIIRLNRLVQGHCDTYAAHRAIEDFIEGMPKPITTRDRVAAPTAYGDGRVLEIHPDNTSALVALDAGGELWFDLRHLRKL